jgi:hypothetical protein
MADRCPQCNAEYGPGDRYCPVCGTPRSEAGVDADPRDFDSAAAGWSAPPGSATRVETGDDDYVPLVYAPIPGGGRPRGRRTGRVVAAALIALLLLGLVGVAAWLFLGWGDEDDPASLGRSELPAWVLDGSPNAATPVAAVASPAEAGGVDVARNNIAVNEPSSDASATPGASGPVRDEPVPSATLAPTVTPSPTAAPSATATPSPSPTPGLPAVAVVPGEMASVLARIASAAESPTPDPPSGSMPTSAPTQRAELPTLPAPWWANAGVAPSPTAAPSPTVRPTGDGTGGAPISTPPEA